MQALDQVLFPEAEPATYYIEMDPGIANAEDSGLAEEVAGLAPREVPEVPAGLRLSGLEPVTITDRSLFLKQHRY